MPNNQEKRLAWPKITVVTPSYNQGQFLEETILSVVNQGYPNLEYFIVDGGSTDNSIEIIKEYEDRIDWWVSEPDKGQSDAIRKGFAKASGVLLNWLNSDDIMPYGTLWKIARAYLHHPKAYLITGDMVRCSSDGRIMRFYSPPSRFAVFARSWVFPFGQQSTFFSSEAYFKVGCIDPDLQAVMDKDLHYRILVSGGKVVRVRGVVGMIRVHNESKGERCPAIFEKERMMLWEKHGITKLQNKIALLFSRVIRCLDGSLLRAYIGNRKFVGKKLYE